MYSSQFLVWLGASVLLHFVGSLGLMELIDRDDSLSGLPEALEPLLETPDDALGIARSRAVTVNWLGFETPTEHKAPLAAVEQPALVLPDPAEMSPAEASEDAPEAPAALTPAEPAPGREIIAVASEGMQRARRHLEGKMDAMVQRLQAALRAASESAAARTSESADRPGIRSDRESDPTSLAQTLEVKPGQVIAAEGVEVRTVRAEWRLTTLLTASPKNPLVRIEFGRDGAVANAEFIESSGEEMVDGPLLNAIYRWTASGPAIEALGPRGPDARFGVTIRVLLVR